MRAGTVDQRVRRQSFVSTKARVPTQNKVRFSRINVFLRDGFRCQYCGAKRPAGELNYDHVLPRVRGGTTIWENIVTSATHVTIGRGAAPRRRRA